MKLATYKDGSRDGQLVVVSRDLTTAHFATGIATRLQQALDDWNFIAPLLQDLSVALNHGKTRHAFPFVPEQCMAPLPRAFQWAAGVASVDAVEPLLVQGGSDGFLGPCDAATFASVDGGIDVDSGLAVVTGDIPQGASPEQALEGVRLLMLSNDWRLRDLAAAELARGHGFVQSRPGAAFGPVAVTLDELGDAWQGGRVHLPLTSTWNGRQVGECEAGAGMRFHFGQLIAHLARTRPVRAGAIVGSGAVGQVAVPSSGAMQYGDVIRIEMKRDRHSVFGAIEQQVLECE